MYREGIRSVKPVFTVPMLLNFLTSIESRLRSSNDLAIADVVNYATHFSIGSTTEFLCESRIALLALLNEKTDALSPTDLQEIREMITAIEVELARTGFFVKR